MNGGGSDDRGSVGDPYVYGGRSDGGGSGLGGGSSVHGELRVLVSTDVLSEGQNLQDTHIIVNYDLPWAIVKLVQRAGRVDRIGQNSPEVLVYSLLPTASVEEEIELRGRIRQRLGEDVQLLGSDEAFFGDASDEHPEIAQRVASLPDIVYSTKHTRSTDYSTRTTAEADTDCSTGATSGNGVLVHTQTVTGADAFAFVEPGGQARRVTPQEALRIAACDPDTEPRIICTMGLRR